MNKLSHALRQRTYCLLISLSGGMLPVCAAIIIPPLHVTLTGSGTMSGGSWANATTLQAALATAANTQEVWVQIGTYKPGTLRTASFNLPDGVQLLGGFPAPTAAIPDPDDRNRNAIANPTILSGEIGAAGLADNSIHVVVANGLVERTLVDGFTIRDGNANLASNFLGISSGNEYGGGFLVNLTGVNLTVRQYLLTQNEANYGGGMYNVFSATNILDCTFMDNNALYGGGMYNGNATSTVLGCIFAYNNARSGGGMENYFSSCNVVNSVLIGNTGGGIYYDNSGSENLVNCTFVNNVANGSGGGIYIGHVFNNINIKNTIVWYNRLIDNTLSSLRLSAVSSVTITNSNIQGRAPDANGNINQDPLFFNLSNPAGADGIFRTADDGLRLTALSPSVNTGTNAGAPNLDILGIARPQSGTVDMGAYEFQRPPSNPTLSISASANPICPNTSVTFTAVPIFDAGLIPIFQWFKNGVEPVGTNSLTYTDATLNHNDRITCVMSIDEHQLNNSSLTSISSNEITMIVNAPIPPQVQIYVVGGVWRIEAGIPLTFNALVTNGTPTSVYLWFKNGAAVGTNSPTYTDSALRDGDEITCRVTNGLPCPASGVSQRIGITVLPRAVCNCH